MTLDLYIARRFLWLFTQVFGGFFVVMVAIDIIEQLRRFSGTSISLGQAAVLSMLNVPGTLHNILPLIMILAAIGLFLSLAKSSELVVVRASGRSGLRFLLAPVGASLLIGAVVVAVFNPIVAATSKEYDQRLQGLVQGGSVLSVNESGLWLRQASETGQTVVQAARANLDGTILYGVTFLIYDAQGLLSERILSAEANLTPGAWVLHNAKTWHLSGVNPERNAEQAQGETRIPTDLTRDKIVDGFGTPSAVSFWDLPQYIKELEAAGFTASAHRVWYQLELALPLMLAAMVLIAAGFTMRHARVSRSGSQVLLALLGGFSVFFLRNFGQVLGENGQIPIMMAAWAPPLAAALAALGLLLHLEDG